MKTTTVLAFALLLAGCSSSAPGDAGDAGGADATQPDVSIDTPVTPSSDAFDASDGGTVADGAVCVDPNGRPLAAGGGYYNGCVIEFCVADAGFVSETVACGDGGPWPDGAPAGCTTDADCGGRWCVFNVRGCGARGACLSDFAAPSTDCTTDRVAYCGCDGTTFLDSSSCPRHPYAQWGACSSTR